MKNLIYTLLVCGLLASCGKEAQTNHQAEMQKLSVADRTDNCNVVTCSIKVEVDVSLLNVLNHFKIFEEYATTSPIWSGQCGSLECLELSHSIGLNSGQWYEIELEENQQYTLTYKHEHPCTTHGLDKAKAKVFFMANGSVAEFNMSTGNTPSTNPDVMYFYRQGCTVLEGQIE